MMTAERARWLLLVCTLVLSLGGGLAIALVKITEIDRQQDRDICDMINAAAPAGAPPPGSERERQRTEAIEHFRQRRC